MQVVVAGKADLGPAGIAVLQHEARRVFGRLLVRNHAVAAPSCMNSV